MAQGTGGRGCTGAGARAGMTQSIITAAGRSIWVAANNRARPPGRGGEQAPKTVGTGRCKAEQSGPFLLAPGSTAELPAWMRRGYSVPDQGEIEKKGSPLRGCPADRNAHPLCLFHPGHCREREFAAQIVVRHWCSLRPVPCCGKHAIADAATHLPWAGAGCQGSGLL